MAFCPLTPAGSAGGPPSAPSAPALAGAARRPPGRRAVVFAPRVGGGGVGGCPPRGHPAAPPGCSRSASNPSPENAALAGTVEPIGTVEVTEPTHPLYGLRLPL